MRFFEDKDIKKITYLFLSIIIISVLIFGVLFLWYNNKLTEEAEFSSLNIVYSNLAENKIANNSVEEVSFSEDKNIENSVSNKIVEDNREPAKEVQTSVKDTSLDTDKASLQEVEFEGNEIEVEPYVLSFEAPISGEISKDFASDTLVYSKTLDEWTTHLGIDIKAEKTTVVKASEKGTVESIKEDPRYGLTIIISHQDEFKTIYSNLLTTEFVSIGDTVEKGQTIGTVGQSSSFEALDDSHLHFEMYKDGLVVNPTIYFK